MSPANTPQSRMFEPGEYDWIEKAGIENLKGRIATADTLAKEASATLTIFLAGAGGAWAYAVKLLDETATRGGVAALIAAVWLTLLAMILVLRCLRIEAIPAVYNQPGQLLQRQQAGETLDEWKRVELENIEARILDAVRRNDLMAKRLNDLRMLATLTPVLAAAGVWLYVRSLH
jgi:hypothetical protein